MPLSAEEDSPPAVVDEEIDERGVIDFERDVHPILSSRCLKCHGPEDAKNDFRVDLAETLLAYVEPGDIEASSLWNDYLITDDPDMLMPPTGDETAEPLSGAELATIKLWIEEGAVWNLVSAITAEPATPVPQSLMERIWIFQGLFHPATTHFPIALLTVSALFVFLSYIRPDTCEPVAFHCLWIGALGAIVAAAADWSYAVHEGYGPSFSFDLFHSAIDRHRWLGIAVAAVSVCLIPVGVYVRRTEDAGMRFIWMLGSLLLLVGVGLSGYQGGELTYGEGHYEKEFVRLFPEALSAFESDEPQVVEASKVENGNSEVVDDVPAEPHATADSSTAAEDDPDVEAAKEAAADTEPAQDDDPSNQEAGSIAPVPAEASQTPAAEPASEPGISEAATTESSTQPTSDSERVEE